MKIALVIFFTNNFGGFAPDYFSAIEGLQTIVTNALEDLPTNVACGPCVSATGTEPYMAIWGRIDCLIGKIFGFGSNVMASGVNFALSNGIIGILGAAIFSGTVGVQLFVAGVTAVISLVLFVCRSVYAYLLAITMGGVMITMSPLFIPTVLFSPTKHMFDRWLDQLISIIGQVVVLTGAMALFFVLICGSIQTVEEKLGTAYSHAQRTNKRVFPESWKIPMDPFVYIQFAEKAVKHAMASKILFINRILETVGQGASEEEIEEMLDKNIIPPIPSFLNPLEGKTMDPLGAIQVPWLDFGPNQNEILHGLVIAMITLAIMCYVMSAFIKIIPQMIAQGMGQGPSGVNVFDAGQGKQKTMPGEEWLNEQMAKRGQKKK